MGVRRIVGSSLYRYWSWDLESVRREGSSSFRISIQDIHKVCRLCDKQKQYWCHISVVVDKVQHIRALGFIASSAADIVTIRKYLTEKQGITFCLIELDALSRPGGAYGYPKHHDVSWLIQGWWRVLFNIGIWSWGVPILLHCDIAGFLNYLRSISATPSCHKEIHFNLGLNQGHPRRQFSWDGRLIFKLASWTF